MSTTNKNSFNQSVDNQENNTIPSDGPSAGLPEQLITQNQDWLLSSIANFTWIIMYFFMGTTMSLMRAISVSYTHLDVYKRQTLWKRHPCQRNHPKINMGSLLDRHQLQTISKDRNTDRGCHHIL